MEQEIAKYKTCPNCGKRMIKWGMDIGSTWEQWVWEWRCGCGHTESGGIAKTKTNDDMFLRMWKSSQKSAQWNKVDLNQTVFLKDGKQYIAEIASQAVGPPLHLLRMTEIEGIDDNGEAIRKGA